jgi:hypothetical protein
VRDDAHSLAKALDVLRLLARKLIGMNSGK